MFEVLLSARESVGQLMDRAYYLVLLGAHDSELITETRLARAESLWLQESLDLRAERLLRLQERSTSSAIAIEKHVAGAEKKAQRIGADIARLVAVERAGLRGFRWRADGQVPDRHGHLGSRTSATGSR